MERDELDPTTNDELDRALAAAGKPRGGGEDDDELVGDEELDDDASEGAEDEDALADELPDELLLEEDAAAPELVRLNKYLADHGVASRRRCDELIQGGQVTVDDAIVTELGTKIDPERQKVEIDGFVLVPKRLKKRYYLLNKPGGVVCTNENRELRPRAVDLITDPRKGRIYTVGRLDEESKGLILLTNDGEFAQRIMHPRHGVEKTYLVRVRGKIDDAALQKIRNGIHLSEGRTSGARVLVHERQRDSSWLSVTIHEGMNREIRRSFARVGYKVLELKRTRIGPLTDRGLKIGRWRELTRAEVLALQSGAPPATTAARRGKPGQRPPRTFSGKGGLAQAERRREERVGRERPEARGESGGARRGGVERDRERRGGGAFGGKPRGGEAFDGDRRGGGRFGDARRAGGGPGARRGGAGAFAGGPRSGADRRGGGAGRPTPGTRPGPAPRERGERAVPPRGPGAAKPARGRGGDARRDRSGGPAERRRPGAKRDQDRPRSGGSFPAPMRRPGAPERGDA